MLAGTRRSLYVLFVILTPSPAHHRRYAGDAMIAFLLASGDAPPQYIIRPTFGPVIRSIRPL